VLGFCDGAERDEYGFLKFPHSKYVHHSAKVATFFSSPDPKGHETTITHTLKYLTKSIHIGSYLPVATGTGGCLSLINRRIKKSTKGIHTSNNNTN
jgi:hypothetical protein